jgi:hypothetical protein
VLTVRQHTPKLFKGDTYELRQSTLTLPESIEKALNIDELFEKNLQFKSANSAKGAGTGNGVMYHGHGGGKDQSEDERHRFYRLIDSMVGYDIDKTLPLILAGTESEIAEFRALSKHPNIARNHIELHNGEDNLKDIFERALEIIHEEIVQKVHMSAIERFERLRGQSPEKTTSYLEDLQKAAENGRVDTLLIGMSRETRDTVNDSFKPVPKLVFPADEDNRTVDYIARQVFHQRGAIFNLSQDEMPDHKLVLGINRY